MFWNFFIRKNMYWIYTRGHSNYRCFNSIYFFFQLDCNFLSYFIQEILNIFLRSNFRACNRTWNDIIYIKYLFAFRPIKRIPDIISAFKIISKKITCKLALIGDGPERPNAEKMTRNLGISKSVDKGLRFLIYCYLERPWFFTKAVFF